MFKMNEQYILCVWHGNKLCVWCVSLCVCVVCFTVCVCVQTEEAICSSSLVGTQSANIWHIHTRSHSHTHILTSSRRCGLARTHTLCNTTFPGASEQTHWRMKSRMGQEEDTKWKRVYTPLGSVTWTTFNLLRDVGHNETGSRASDIKIKGARIPTQ